MTRGFLKPLACLALLISLATPNLAPANDHAEKVLEAFTAHVGTLQLSAEQKNRIQETLQESADDPQYGITESLALAFPEYGKAIETADVAEVAQAIQALQPLVESQDPFLSADASFYLARTLMNGERFEDAVAPLKQLTGKMGQYSAHQGSAQYYMAVAKAGLLKNQEAINAFMEFLQFNPDAPERLRVSAWRQVQQLQSIQAGQLDDVYQRMDYSRRRLELIETDEATQTEQDKIVNMLTKLIKEEEKKECSNCKGKSDKPPKKPGQKPQAQNKPGQSKSKSGGSSSNPNGKAVVKNYDDSPASPWSRLRDRSRDPANNAVKEKLPARYRDIVEKYIEAANGDK